MNPIDYLTGLGPSVQDSFTKGLAIGDALIKQRKEADDRRKLEELTARRKAVYARLGPNAGYQDYMSAIAELPEDRDGLLKTMQAMGETKQRALFDAGVDAFSLLSAGKSTDASARLEEYAKGFENSGDKTMARQLRDASTLMQIDPQAGRTI